MLAKERKRKKGENLVPYKRREKEKKNDTIVNIWCPMYGATTHQKVV